MKKTTITLLLLLGFLVPVFAGPVDIATARIAGLRFFCMQKNRIRPYPLDSVICTRSYPEMYQGEVVYYIFNLQNKGFVIVSADNSVTPVLGYSFDGTYSPENQPPQFISWMEGYSRQIAWAKKEPYAATQATLNSWQSLTSTEPFDFTPQPATTDVAPLLISTWDQGYPYNLLCPLDAGGSGGRVWAGCVATAMSQVMYYYRWPDTGTGQHCYVPSGYPQQCADFGATSYKWNEMTNIISTAWDDTAGATLLWHAGISVDMMYGANGSGAYSQDARNALVGTFKYTPNSELIEKSNYSESQWSQIMRDNLDLKRPLYYDGYGTGGHAFNLDGYQGTDYFHFNWGWSGSFNGYFYLNNLNPGGENFTQGQGAIVNLYPDTVNYVYPSSGNGQTILTALAGTFEDGSGPVKNYPDNCNRSWLIRPQSESDSIVKITINFNKFNTESGADLVKVYKGSSTADSLVGTFSGSTLPPAIVINNNQALVTFQSNASVTSEGWFATYTTRSAEWCAGSKTLTDPAQSVTDGSGSFHYRNRTLCKWYIMPSEPGAVTFTFTKFRTETGSDLVKFYDLGLGQMVSSYSGDYNESNLPAPVTCSSGKMLIVFLTNGSNTDDGWEGYYSIYPAGVGNGHPESNIVVYPSPAHDVLSVKLIPGLTSPVRLELISNAGKQVRSMTYSNAQTDAILSCDVSGLSSGVYYLRMITPETTIVRKVLVD